MSACRVTLLRARAATVVTLAICGVLPASSLADQAAATGGGAAVPGGDLPGEPIAAAPSSVPAENAEPVPVQQATQEATVVGSTAALLAPPLATPLRRLSDPVAADLAGLGQPSGVAAIDGHVVIVRARGGRSELVDVGDPAAPRIVLSSTRAFGAPNAGRNVDGHPVIVVSPCAGTDEVLLLRRAPNCPLRVVDLVTGLSSAVSGTSGALQGDVAGANVVFTRQSPEVGVRLYLGVGGRVRPLALPKMGKGAENWPSTIGDPIPGTLSAGGLDLGSDGRIAVVVGHRAKAPKHTSTLWLRDGAGGWRRAVSVNTPRDDLGVRRVLGPQLDEGGVRAYVEGVVDGPSFVGRWTNAGESTTRFSVRRSIGRATILRDAAYDGTRMVFVDWLPGLPCGSEGANACGVRALGPLAVR